MILVTRWTGQGVGETYDSGVDDGSPVGEACGSNVGDGSLVGEASGSNVGDGAGGGVSVAGFSGVGGIGVGV